MVDAVLHEYQWLVVVGAFAAFAFGFGTGSNDVANAFGTSVGAKTLTLRQAVVIAAIFEFTGAMVLGRVSTSTIAGGIADIKAFQREPEMYAYGMVCALSVSAVWQVVASYFELNVSSTHSIIGSIMGFSLVYGGSNAVLWQQPDPSSFPPYKGVVPIIVSWFFSPVFTAIIAAIIFGLVRLLVLRREKAYQLSFWVLPPMVILTVFVCIYFVLTKGAKKSLSNNDWDDNKSAWVSAIVAAACGFICAVVVLPILRYRANKRFDDQTVKEATVEITTAPVVVEAQKEVDVEADKQSSEDFSSDDSGLKGRFMKAMNASKRAIMHGTTVDIHQVVEEDELVNALHANAEVFDPKVEYTFSYLQVFSAICVIFSHGAGEVGYMAGPLATVWATYQEGLLPKEVSAPAWVVFIGAIGLVIGLATYGYNVTRAMGVKLSKLSPTRGFAAELATALVIMIASQYKLPTSSSQCITGGIIGVGLMEGKLGVNWKFFAKQFSSWIATLFISAIFTAALFAQGVYTPSKISGAQQVFYEDRVGNLTNQLLKDYNTTLLSFKQAATDNQLPNLAAADWQATYDKINALSKTVTKAASTSQQTVDADKMMQYLYKALSLYQDNNILSVGQTNTLPGAPVCNNNVTVTDQSAACQAAKLVPKGYYQKL